MNDDDSGVHKPLVDNFEKFQEYTDKISENIPIVANYVEALKEYKGKMGTQQDTKSMRTRMNHEIGEANELIKQTLDLIQDLEDLKFKNKKDTDNKKKMLRRLNNSFEDYYEEFTKLIKEIHSNEKRFIDLQQSIFNASTMSEESTNIPNGHKGSVYDSTIQKSSLIGDVNNDVEHRNQAVIGSIHEDNDENEEVHIDDIVEENNNNMEEKLLMAENKEEEPVHKSESIVRDQEVEEKENVVVEEKLHDEIIEKKENNKESLVGEKEEQHEEAENVVVEQEKEKEEEVKENIEEEPVHKQEEDVVEENNDVKENIIIQETPVQEEENKEILNQEEEEVKENIEETPVQEEEIKEKEEESKNIVTQEEEVKENIEETPVQEGIKENEEIVQEATIQGGEEVKEEIVHETPVQERVEDHKEIIEETVQEIKEEEPVIIETQQVNKESIRKEEVLNLDIVPEKNTSIVQETVAFKESIHEKKNGESVILKKSVREEIPRESIRMKSSVVREDVQALKQSIMEAKNNLDFYASIIQQRERQMSTVKRISSETNLLEGGRGKDEEGNVGIVINDVSHSQTMDRVIEGGVDKKEKKSNTKRNVLIVLAILLILGAIGAGVALNMKK